MSISEAALSAIGADAYTPAEIGQLFVQDLAEASVIGRSHRFETTRARSLVLPTAAPGTEGAAFIGEADTIPESTPELSGYEIIPRKLATVVTLSNESVADSGNSVLNAARDAVVRQLQRKLDTAVLSGSTDTAAPLNLSTLAGVNAVEYDSVDLMSLVDEITAAQALASAMGHPLTFLIADADLWAGLAQLRTAEGSNVSLFSATPESGTGALSLVVQGIPVLVSEHAPAGTLYGIPKDCSYFVVRSDVEAAVSGDARFTTDQLVLRVKMRLNVGYPDPSPVARFTVPVV